MLKKTLFTKFPMDVSLMSDAQIAACKAYMATNFKRDGVQVEFDLVSEEVSGDDFIELLRKQTVGLVDKVLSKEQPEQAEMPSIELDESQSNVLRGFFASRDEPG